MIPANTFYSVSDNAHALAGCLAILGPIALGLNHPWCCAAIIIVLAAIKEGLIDPRTETPIVAGSGLRDFAGYCVGTAVGLGLHFWLRYLIARIPT